MEQYGLPASSLFLPTTINGLCTIPHATPAYRTNTGYMYQQKPPRKFRGGVFSDRDCLPNVCVQFSFSFCGETLRSTFSSFFFLSEESKKRPMSSFVSSYAGSLFCCSSAASFLPRRSVPADFIFKGYALKVIVYFHLYNE